MSLSVHIDDPVRIYLHDIDDLSEDTKSVLVEYLRCVRCGVRINCAFSPCVCRASQNKRQDDIGVYSVSVADFEAYVDAALIREEERHKSRRSAAIRREHEKWSPGFYTSSDIRMIWELQLGRCHFCGVTLGGTFEDRAFVKDHLSPVSSLQGTHWPHNIALTCERCNQDKHGRGERAFWNKLKRERGEEWVSQRIAVAKAKVIVNEKQKLTSIRREERRAALYELTDHLSECVLSAAHDWNCSGDVGSVNAVELTVKDDHPYLDIEFGEVSISVPAPCGGQRSVRRWTTRNSDLLADAVLTLASIKR